MEGQKPSGLSPQRILVSGILPSPPHPLRHIPSQPLGFLDWGNLPHAILLVVFQTGA